MKKFFIVERNKDKEIILAIDEKGIVCDIDKVTKEAKILNEILFIDVEEITIGITESCEITIIVFLDGSTFKLLEGTYLPIYISRY